MRPARLLLWALSPIIIYLAVAVVGAIVPAKSTPVAGNTDQRWIILVQGPIHYDILLPLDDDTRVMFDFLNDAGVPVSDYNAAWLSVGWGSEAFYTTTGRYADVSLGAVTKAVTGDSGVMRFEAYGPVPIDPDLHRIPIDAAQLDALRASIRADLARTPVPLPIAGFSSTDAFYPADGRFHILRTCNVWVGRKLAAAGLGFGAWTPTPYAVTLSLWWNGHLDAASD